MMEEMEKARERVKGGCHKLKEDESKAAWPLLHPGDMVRGQHPNTKEWSLKGEVLEMVHGDSAVNMDLDDGSSRLFARDAVRKDTTRAYREEEEEELRSQLAGTVGEARPDEQLEENMRGRRQKLKPNMEDVEPRRSLRLAKKNVTMGRLGMVDDPEVLPYYMEAVERGYAGIRQSTPRGVSEEEDASLQAPREQQEPAEQEDAGRGQEETTEDGPLEEL